MPDGILQFLAGPFLIETPIIFSWAVFLFAFGVFIFPNSRFLKRLGGIYKTDTSNRPDRSDTSDGSTRLTTSRSDTSDTSYKPYAHFYFRLLAAAAAFRFFISFFETFLQYYVWKKNPLTEILLVQPLSADVPVPAFIRNIFFGNPRGYFFYYAWGHFFLNVFLSILSAIAFYYFLVFLRKYRARFFGEGEIVLGTLMAFLAGWPNVVLFVPLALILTVVISVVRSIFWNKNYTTLGLPFLVSGFATLAFGKLLIELFHLGALG
ncbi:MAG: hypothetical protein HY433_02820 [Candidatus Liptonbacteria bacterium]|nr:hypothetical protein [Candidatus Liptonbacteria bacterium]